MGSFSKASGSKMTKRLTNVSDPSNAPAGETENVWSQILSEVRTNASTKMPSGKSIVVLGGSEVGKTTLVAKLQGTDAPKKGSGLEYAYIEIRDEYRDDSAQLSVWVLDGNPLHSNLLRFPLTENSFSDTLVMLTVSMATPWSILEDLQTWAGILHDHIDTLRLGPDRIRELRDRTARRWMDYSEPTPEEESLNSNSKPKAAGQAPTTDEATLPPYVLGRNTGLDIVVVVTKTDYMSMLERDCDYRDEHWDFIQLHVRQFCVQYGASLFYTSVKEEKNCDLLYKYLVHRVYGLPFKTPALLVEKDALFIPSGWDSEKKMSILHESMSTVRPDQFFNDVILKPVSRKAATAATQLPQIEIEVEDEQKFLERQAAALHSGGSSGGAGLAKSTSSPSPKNPSPKIITPGTGGNTQKKGDPTSQERVLANFFNSLLSKKSGSPSNTNTTSPSGNAATGKSSDDSRTEVTAELDSLINKKEGKSLASSDC